MSPRTTRPDGLRKCHCHGGVIAPTLAVTLCFVVTDCSQNGGPRPLATVRPKSELTTIDGGGRLTFPALAPEGEQFLAGVTTVDEFRTAASESSETVVLALPEVRD
jgi:hypothetical protein